MKMTKELRASIVSRAISATFGKRLAAHDKARIALADAIYAHQYGAAEKIAKKLPAGWVDSTRSIYIEHPDYGMRCSEPSGLALSKSHLCPRTGGYIAIGKDHPLRQRCDDLAKAGAALSKERDTARVKLVALLNGCSTLKQIHERWPEGKAFYPADEKRAVTTLVPVTLIAEVNAALGLNGAA